MIRKIVLFVRVHLTIITIVIMLLMYIVVLTSPVKVRKFGDLEFHKETKLLVGYVLGTQSYEALSITKAPGPVLFFAGPYLLAGPNADDNTLWVLAVVWTGCFMIFSIILLQKACHHFGYPNSDIIVLVLSLIIPLHLYYSLGVSAEPVAFLACCITIYGYSIKERSFINSLICIYVGILVLILARPNAGLVIPLLLLYFLYLFFRDRQLFRSLLKGHLIGLASVVAIVFLITWLIKQLPNKRSTYKQEQYFSYVMQMGRFQFREESWDWRFWDPVTRPDSKDYNNWVKTRAELDHKIVKENRHDETVYMGWVINDMLTHPLLTVKQFLLRAIFGNTLQISSVKPANFSLGIIRGPAAYWTFMVGLNLINISIFCFSVLFIIKTKDFGLQFGMLIMPWLALLVFHSIVYMEHRYMFAARPIMLIFASFYISTLFKYGTSKFTPGNINRRSAI